MHITTNGTYRIAPTLNLNGTDFATLEAEWRKVYSHAQALEQALREVTVHGRDFQTASHPDNALRRAQKENWERIQWARRIQDDAVGIVQSLHAQEAGEANWVEYHEPTVEQEG